MQYFWKSWIEKGIQILAIQGMFKMEGGKKKKAYYQKLSHDVPPPKKNWFIFISLRLNWE